MKKIYIDAGGTKIAAYLLTSNGVVKKVLNEPGNINTNYESAKNNIIVSIDSFSLDSKHEIIIGAAGASGSVLLANKLKKALETFFPIHSFEVLGDLDLVCHLIKEDNFLLINCGTGTVAINKTNNVNSLYLGWGKLVNDIGSGYDIGINFIKFLSLCEDKFKTNNIYLKFLQDYRLNSVREFIDIITTKPKEISNLSLWLSCQSKEVIRSFILSRINELFKYLNFLKFENLYLIGSIFEKNKDVQEFTKDYFPNKNINIINIQLLLENKYYKK